MCPEQLNLAEVIPLFKKGATYLPGNYRPISLLNIFDKLLEKVMYNRLYNHLQANNILYDFSVWIQEKLLNDFGSS